MMVHATFYGKVDAPGVAKFTGQSPGGDGTYANPLTMAGDTAWTWIAKGGIVYSKALKRYYVFNDECQGCLGTASPPTVDFWVGSSGGDDRPCAGSLMIINQNPPSNGTTPIIVNPSSTLETISVLPWDGAMCNIPAAPYPTS